MGRKISARSASSKAPFHRYLVGTWPVMHTRGTDSMNAAVTPITRLVPPGDRVPTHTAGRRAAFP